MANLFLDIETVPDFSQEEYFLIKNAIERGQLDRNSVNKDLYWKFERGGLSPFEGKVILITYKINDGHVFRLKEWEIGEQQILKQFYQLILDLEYRSMGDRLQVIGHNILRFDLFFLYERMKYYQIDDVKWLHQRIINKPEVIDFLQMHLPLNELKTKGLRHDVIMHAYNFPTKTTLGSEEVIHYYEKQYKKILDYSEREFIYPELYEKISKKGMISPEALKEAIRWYEKNQQPNSIKS